MLITVNVAPHPIFKPDGANLRAEVPITLYEAVLGGKIRVPIWEFRCQWQKNMILAIAKPDTPLPKNSKLAITCPEVRVGETNRQYLRRNAIGPSTGVPGMFPQ